MRQTIVFLEQQSWAGGAQRVLDAILESARPGFDCVVALPGRGNYRAMLEERGIETIDLPIGSYRPGAKSFFEIVRFLWRSLYCGLKLGRVVRQRSAALVYINGPRCLPAGVLAATLAGRPSIFHLHLILERRIEALLVSRLARRVSRIFGCSEAAAACLTNRDLRLSPKTRVLYNPLPRAGDRRPALDRSSDLLTLGIVGRITPAKGHHVLLEALARLPEPLRRRQRLLIVGSGAPGCEADDRYAAFLRAEAARAGFRDRIVWAGFRTDPWPWYASMDVLVHPALAEAMCMVILEALSQGVPVIATRTGGIPEVVSEGANGLLVPPDDPDALAGALIALLDDTAMCKRLRAGAGQPLDSRFWPETFSSGIRRAIDDLCCREGSGAPVRTEGA